MSAERCFVGGWHYSNLAERLASQVGGIVAHQHKGEIRCKELVILTDGSDLDSLIPVLSRIGAERQRILCIGMNPAGVSSFFTPGAAIHGLEDGSLTQLWRSALSAMASDAPVPMPLPPIFLSHAVQDEAQLLPVVAHLRRYAGANIFLCADSIEPGSLWLPAIQTELRRCSIFLLAVSKASKRSHFCAFEVGMAVAMDKRLSIVSLDGSSPPAYIQNIQAADVPRLQGRKPWLSHEEACIEAVLDAIRPACV
jgi:hypothetical protein